MDKVDLLLIVLVTITLSFPVPILLNQIKDHYKIQNLPSGKCFAGLGEVIRDCSSKLESVDIINVPVDLQSREIFNITLLYPRPDGRPNDESANKWLRSIKTSKSVKCYVDIENKRAWTESSPFVYFSMLILFGGFDLIIVLYLLWSLLWSLYNLYKNRRGRSSIIANPEEIANLV